jgi:hypothetical protein
MKVTHWVYVFITSILAYKTDLFIFHVPLKINLKQFFVISVYSLFET